MKSEQEAKLKADEEAKKYTGQKALEEARKKAEEDRLKAEQNAKLKADEEAKKLADKKAKAEAERIQKQNLKAMKQEKRKHIQDSLANLAISTVKVKVQVQKSIQPVFIKEADDVQSVFNGTGTYSINIAKQSLNASKEKRNKEKAANLSAKYETNNTLTSLLDVVDENDKQHKSEFRSQK